MTEVSNQQLDLVKAIHMEIDYDSIHIESEWNYNSINDDCELCNTSLYESLIKRSKYNVKQNILHTNIVSGECSHAFHRQCMNKHMKKNNLCPLCPNDNQENNIFKFKQNLENVTTVKLFKD